MIAVFSLNSLCGDCVLWDHVLWDLPPEAQVMTSKNLVSLSSLMTYSSGPYSLGGGGGGAAARLRPAVLLIRVPLATK